MKRLQRWFPTFLAIYRWYRKQLTTPGRLMVAALVVSVPGVAGEQPMSIQLFSMLLLTMIVATVLGRLFRPRAQVTMHAPASVRCGRPLELRVRLSNQGRRSCYDLTVSLAPGRQLRQWELLETRFPAVSLGPGESASGVIVVRPLRRGRHPSPRLRVSTTFPLNLMHFHQAVPSPHDIVVTPDFAPLEQVDLAPRGGGSIRNESTIQATGESWEYCGSREYQEGLPVRRWDYGAWARLGDPAVREFEEFTQANAIVLVDGFVEGAAVPQDDETLESTLSLAASLVDALCAEQWQIHLLAVDAGGPAKPMETAHVRELLMERLAVAAKAPDQQVGQLADAAAASSLPLRDMTVFVVLSCWDQPRERLCRRLTRRADEVRTMMAASSLTAPAHVLRPPAHPAPWRPDNQPPLGRREEDAEANAETRADRRKARHRRPAVAEEAPS